MSIHFSDDNTPLIGNENNSDDEDFINHPDRDGRIFGGTRNEVTQRQVDVDPTNYKEKWRNLIAFWFLGLTNNFAYVVMLSAAHDLLSNDFNNNVLVSITSEERSTISPITTVAPPNNPRDCNLQSTGIILLADIIPSLTVKALAPFIKFQVHVRTFVAVVLCSLSFLLVGFAPSTSIAILGVICASASSGIGEATFLTYTSFYHRDVLSTWSSGTGGAGVLGSISYAGLTSLGLKPRQCVLLMLIVPVILSFSFWILLEHPRGKKCCKTRHEQILQNDEFSTTPDVGLNLRQKLSLIPSLLQYMLPLNLVYVAEYLINQGLTELIYFPKYASWLSHNEQYRWYQVLYQVGVFISRSSVNLIYIDKLWLPALFQWLNVIVFLSCAIFMWLGNIWIVFGLILWEGLLGGAAYVNTFYKMSKEVPREHQEFALQITTMSDTLGVAIAGFIAVPLHNAICNLPLL